MMNLNDNKMFACNQCESKFTTKGHLKQHIKSIHDKINDFECDQCESKFSTNGHLNRHTKTIHNKIKDCKCNQCDFKCSINDNLIKHVNMVHLEIKNISCNQCDIKFYTTNHLTRHKKAIHLKIKDIICNQCKYTCSTNEQLKTHIQQVHERPQESKKMSLGEYKIYKILEKLDIEFKREFTFQDLKSDKRSPLRYDFGIKLKDDNYLLIEFDGKQHFQKVKWSNIESEQQIIERFEYLQKCDIQKNEYAKNNNHDLLRIKYDDKDVEKRITDYFNEHYEIK